MPPPPPPTSDPAAPSGTISLREFFDALAAGRLVAQRCLHCGALALPPRPLCTCGHYRFEPVALSGDGTIEHCTEIALPSPSAAAISLVDAPSAAHALVVVMREGLRVTGRLLGPLPDGDPIGAPVSLAPVVDHLVDHIGRTERAAGEARIGFRACYGRRT